MSCAHRSAAIALDDPAPTCFAWTAENDESACDLSSYDNSAALCCSSSDNNRRGYRRSCACCANDQIRNNGYRIAPRSARRQNRTSLIQSIMAWMSSDGMGCGEVRRRRPTGRGSGTGSGSGSRGMSGASLLLALCVTGMVVSRGALGVAAARLPVIDEDYRTNGGEPGVVGSPGGGVEVDPAALGAAAAAEQQALLEYLEEPASASASASAAAAFQSQLYSQQQMLQLALRLRENPELLAQILAFAPAARRYSLTEEVLARMPAAPAGAVEATPGPVPPQPKRGNYMALCHFKICNMGRKRRQEMP